jgi:protein gp37
MRVADDSRAIDQCSGIALAAAWLNGAAPENVWIGTSVGTQKGADERIPQLLAIPARVRFLSCEPLLENLSLERARIPDAEGRAAGDAGIHWVICGTESGQRRRTMNLDWARSLRDQCKAAGVAFFLKQIEECGKIVTEPTLDGVQHLEFPQ